MADQTKTTNKDEFSLANLPPEGHAKAGEFFYSLWQASLMERRRLELEERWMENHRLFRGDHHGGPNRHVVYKNRKKKQTINLLFANIIRTVANITARNPVAEVVSTDGIEDGTDILVSQKIKNWWNDTEQSISLAKSALANEIYGITTEKSVYDHTQKRTDTIVLDAFAALPAPGYYEEWNDCPYFCHAYPMNTALVQKMFGLKEKDRVEGDDIYSLLGEDREENRPIPAGTYFGSQNYPGNYTPIQHPKYGATQVGGEGRALVVELWVRDYSTEKIKNVVDAQPVINPDTGLPAIDPMTGELVMEPIIEVTEQSKYPGNIRVVTFTNEGRLVLDDKPNPNINPALPREISSKTYLYDHLPFFKANSYEDTTSVWGFAAAEQVGDINLEIDEIVTRITNYIRRVTNPPLIIPKDTGITKEMIKNEPGLILRPVSTVASQGIRYLQVPNLPSNFFDALKTLVEFFDRVSAIEDADRGDVPSRVISGAAIAALQERGAVLVRAKIRAVDYLVRQRGRGAISFFQNFGIFPELIAAQGTTKSIRGVDLAGREFNYLVESGSTLAKTSLQVQEQAFALYQAGAIDRQALLENLNFPSWKEIVERVGEGQLSQAIQILIQAGLPQDLAQVLYQQLSQPQGGPGNKPQDAGAKPGASGGNGSAQPGQPPELLKTEQGQVQPSPVGG
jgi:hypothetical protein